MKEPDDGSRRCFLKVSSMMGLAVSFGPATIGEAFADSRIAGKQDTMTRRKAKIDTTNRSHSCGGTDGLVHDISVVTPGGYGLAEAAAKAVKKWSSRRVQVWVTRLRSRSPST